MKMLSFALVSIFSMLVLIIATIGPKPIVYHKRPMPNVHLSAMSYGKKMCIEQSMPVITVNRDRRWFINNLPITSLEVLVSQLNEARLRQHGTKKRAYVRCRIDHRCPARDFLDLHALAIQCGFDGILVAGTVD